MSWPLLPEYEDLMMEIFQAVDINPLSSNHRPLPSRSRSGRMNPVKFERLRKKSICPARSGIAPHPSSFGCRAACEPPVCSGNQQGLPLHRFARLAYGLLRTRPFLRSPVFSHCLFSCKHFFYLVFNFRHCLSNLVTSNFRHFRHCLLLSFFQNILSMTKPHDLDVPS